VCRGRGESRSCCHSQGWPLCLGEGCESQGPVPAQRRDCMVNGLPYGTGQTEPGSWELILSPEFPTNCEPCVSNQRGAPLDLAVGSSSSCAVCPPGACYPQPSSRPPVHPPSSGLSWPLGVAGHTEPEQGASPHPLWVTLRPKTSHLVGAKVGRSKTWPWETGRPACPKKHADHTLPLVRFRAGNRALGEKRRPVRVT